MGTISLHASFKKIEAVCDTLQQGFWSQFASLISLTLSSPSEEASEIQRGLALGLLDAADLKPHTPFATSIEPRASSALSVSHSAEATDREAVAADSATGGDLLDGEPASSSPHLRATLAGSSPHRFAGLNPNPFPFHAALQPCELKFSSSP